MGYSLLIPVLLLTMSMQDGIGSQPDDAVNRSEQQGMLTIEPAAIVEFPETLHGPFSGVIDAQVSESGDAVYVLLTVNTVNLWELAVRFWPEILGTVSAVCFLIGLWFLIRNLRRPRLVGKPHCRKCNHCLHGIESKLCPECGIDTTKKKPIVGRPFKRRVVPTLILSLLIPIAYSMMRVANIPRTGPVSQWFFIESTWLYDELCDHEVIDTYTYGDWPTYQRMVKIDLVQPYKRTKYFTVPRHPWHSEGFVLIDEDEQVLVTKMPIRDSSEPWTALISLRKRHITPIRIPDQPRGLSRSWIPPSTGAMNAVYIMTGSNDPDQASTRELFRFDRTNRSIEHVRTIEPVAFADPSRRAERYRVVGVIDDQNNRFIQIDQNESPRDESVSVTVSDLQSGSELFAFEIPNMISLSAKPLPLMCAVSPNGRFLATLSQTGDILFWDLSAGGALHHTLELRRNTFSQGFDLIGFEFSPSGRYVVVSRFSDWNPTSTFVYEVQGSSQPIAEFGGIDQRYRMTGIQPEVGPSVCVLPMRSRWKSTWRITKTTCDLLLVYDTSAIEDF